MSAGPNGSGKSVLKSYLPPELLGVYLNPDQIEAGIRRDGWLDFRTLGVETTQEEVLQFFVASDFLKAEGLEDDTRHIGFAGWRLNFAGVAVNAYFASVAVDFLRVKLMEKRSTFTFETVVSHPGKVELLRKARAAGYRTYLYHVATDDPSQSIPTARNPPGCPTFPTPP